MATRKTPQTKPQPKQPDAGEIAKRYGWYIDHAFDFRKREIDKQITRARATLTEEPVGGVRDIEARESLAAMADHLEWVQKEFNEAHEALKAAGIK